MVADWRIVCYPHRASRRGLLEAMDLIRDKVVSVGVGVGAGAEAEVEAVTNMAEVGGAASVLRLLFGRLVGRLPPPTPALVSVAFE